MNLRGFRAEVATRSAMLHIARFTQTGELKEMERATAAMRKAVALTSEEDPAYPGRLADLGDSLSQTFDITGERAFLEEALSVLDRALRTAPPGHPGAGRVRISAGIVRLNDFRAGGPSKHLDQGIELLGQAEEMLPRGDADATLALSNLAEGYKHRYIRDGDVADLREHAATLRTVVAATAAGDPYRVFRVAKLVAALQLVRDEPGVEEELERAIETLREGLPGVPEPMRGQIHLIAGMQLYGDLPMFDAEQLAMMRQIMRDMQQRGDTGIKLRGAVLSDLGSVLVAQAMQSGKLEEVDGAIAMLRDALRAGPGNQDRAGLLTNLGRVLGQRIEWTKDVGGVDEMVEILRQAVDAAPNDHPDRGLYLSNLGNGLSLKYTLVGGDDVLKDAIAVYRRALEQIPQERLERAMALTGLAAVLFDAHERWGALAELNEAIDTHRAAVAITPQDNEYRPIYLANLGNALFRRHEATGSLLDLDESVAAMRECVALAPPAHPHRGAWMSSLATGLLMRYDRTGQHSALDESIALFRQALELSPREHFQRHLILINLGRALGRVGTLAALDESVEVMRAAKEAAPPGTAVVHRAGSGLAIALILRFFGSDEITLTDEERLAAMGWLLAGGTGEPPVEEFAARRRLERSERLDESIALLREAINGLPPGDPGRARAAGQLGMALSVQYTLTGKGRQLDRAIRLQREALEGAEEDDPLQSVMRYHLARALTDRWERSGDEKDREEAAAQYRAAASVETAAPTWRAGVAKSWGEFVAAEYGPAAAVEAYAAAVGLLDAAAWRGLQREDQESVLTEFQGLASDAAACAIAAGDPERAVELLEQGRGVLLAQVIDAHPRLDALESLSPESAARLKEIQDGLDAEDDLDRRHVLARSREETLAEIRTLPGLADFLLPPPFSRLRDAAAEGPVVAINVSGHRCDALAVAATGVTLIPLPQLTADGVAGTAAAFVDAIAAYAHDDDPDPELLDRIPATLDWLGENVTGPVLEALGLGETRPRLWWCPTGPLSLLPLHAAALETVVSSYTPTLRALLHAREAAGPRADGKPLAVALPSTPGEADLPGTSQETDTVLGLLPSAVALVGPAATREAVLSALPRSPWAHFACHASQDPSAPSQGRLHLYDGPLTVREIAATRLDRAEFAFLSGCETSRGGDELADECISLAATVQLAGYPSVIGTLWPISDLHAPEVVEGVYRMMTAGGTREPDPAAAAVGLHLAVRALRAEHPGHPVLWAAFTHIGP
ncbi:CHAT domain-containing protein [Nonomuraea sp. NPDC050536]|uniref:CHAT domain-containing protein n=1 Tax=Nonomuraea sp. NPDC050536 TaxID=3364366 RepID=UPI0037CB2CA3